MFQAHPIVGVGLGTYDTVKRAYLPPDWSGWLYTVHNSYLLMLAEAGTVGITALSLLLFMALRMAYRGIRSITAVYRPLQISLVAGLVAIYWEMIWDIFDGKQQQYVLWFLITLAAILPRILPQSQQTRPT
jgi:O-antigen ligase